jgi:hypothetical protein
MTITVDDYDDDDVMMMMICTMKIMTKMMGIVMRIDVAADDASR